MRSPRLITTVAQGQRGNDFRGYGDIPEVICKATLKLQELFSF
jgi:hypothetical protein